MKAIGIIPARYESSRFPGKPLAMIAGKSMIRRVWENAKSASLLDKVIVATDSPLIKREASMHGAEVMMTPPELPSGTDRIHAAFRKFNTDYDVIVNIQGDEPLLKGADIDELISSLEKTEAGVSTLIKEIISEEELNDPGIVKVVLDTQSCALYFSRSSIPFVRDKKSEITSNVKFYRHIGIYAYKRRALERFVKLERSSLEIAESLEQLRLMQDGEKYLCVQTEATLAGVDYPKDIEHVEKLLKQ